MERNNNKYCAILFLKRFEKKSASFTTPSICYIRLDQENSVELHEVKNKEKDKGQLHEQQTTMIAKPLEPILKRSCLIEMLYLTTLEKASTGDCNNVTDMSSMITVSIHYKQLLDRPFLFLSHILNNDATNVNHLQTYLVPEKAHQNNTCFCSGTDLLEDASKKELQNFHCFQKETWMAFFQLITAGGPSTVIEKPYYVYENNSESLFRLLNDLLQDGKKFLSNKLKETSQANLTFTLQQNTQVWRWSATVMLYFILQDISYCREKWENFDKNNKICSGSIKAGFLLGITKCIGVAILLNWQLVQIIISYFVNPLNSSYKNVHNAIALGIKTAQYFFMLDWITKDPHFVYNRLKQQLCDLESLLLQAVKELEQETPEICPYEIDENNLQSKFNQSKPLEYRSLEQSQGHFLNTTKELQTLLSQVQQRLSASPFNWNKALAGKVLLLAFLLDSTCGVLTALTYIMSVTTSPFDECAELSWIFGDLSRDIQLYFFQLRLARHLSLFVIQETAPEFFLNKNHSLDKMNTFTVREEINKGTATHSLNRNISRNAEDKAAYPSSVSWNTSLNQGDYTTINNSPQNNKPDENCCNTISRHSKALDSTNECQRSLFQVETNIMPLLSSREQLFSSVGRRNAMVWNEFEKANHQDDLQRNIETKRMAKENDLYAQQHNFKNVSTRQSTNFRLLEEKINKLELALYNNRSVKEEKKMEFECPKIVKKKCPTKHHVPNGVKAIFTKVRASTPPPSLNVEKNINQMTTPAAHFVAYNESIYQKLKNYEIKMQKAVESLEKRVSQCGSGLDHDVTTDISKDEPEPMQKRKEDVFRKQTASLRSFLAQKAHVERFRKDTLDLLSSDVSQLKKFPGAKTFRQDIGRETRKETGSKTFRKTISGKKLSVQPQPLICNEKFFHISDQKFDNETTQTQNQNNDDSSSSNKPQLNIFFKNLGIKMFKTEHILSSTPHPSIETYAKSPTPKAQQDLHSAVSPKQQYVLKQMSLAEEPDATAFKHEETNLPIRPERRTMNSLKEKQQHETKKVNMMKKESVNIANVHIPKKLVLKEKDNVMCTSLHKHQQNLCPTTTEKFSPTHKTITLPTTKSSALPTYRKDISTMRKTIVSPTRKKTLLPENTKNASPKKTVEVLRTNIEAVSSIDLKNVREINKQREFEGDIETSLKIDPTRVDQTGEMIQCKILNDSTMVKNTCETNLLKSELADILTHSSHVGLIETDGMLNVSSAKEKPTAGPFETKEKDTLSINHVDVTDKVVNVESLSLLDGSEFVNKPVAQEERFTFNCQESFSGKTFIEETYECAGKTKYCSKTIKAQANFDNANYEKDNFMATGEEKIIDEKSNGRKIVRKKKSCVPVKCGWPSKLLSVKDTKVFKGSPFEKLTKKIRVVKTGATIFEATEKKAIKKSITCCVKAKSLLKAKSVNQKNCLDKLKLDFTKISSTEKKSFNDIVLKRRKHWVPTMTPEEETCRIEALRLKRNEKIQKNSGLYLNRYLKQVDALHKISNFSEKPNILFISADNMQEATSASKEKSRSVSNEESTDGMVSEKLLSNAQKSEEEQISFHHLFQDEDDAFDLYIEKNSFL